MAKQRKGLLNKQSPYHYYTASVFARMKQLFYGWRCHDKIIVVESDDWGAIRTSSKQAYKILETKGFDMSRSCWSLDALETDDDLTALYDVLSRFFDVRSRPACITGNMVMTNPDFNAIRNSKYNTYYLEPVAKTLCTSSERKCVENLWFEGMDKKLFRPQFHAREHIRWWEWMRALKHGSKEALTTFDLNMCGVPLNVSKVGVSYYQPTYIENSEDIGSDYSLSDVIEEGIRRFEDQFGLKSLSTIAPNCAWTNDAEKYWSKNGVRYIQGSYCQEVITRKGCKYKPHYLGEVSRYGGIYMARNCVFEPARNNNDDHWKRSIKQISQAFYLKSPAVITSHRLNYSGSINEANRYKGLMQLNKLLKEVTKRWPEVHFLSSAELGYMIENGIKRVDDLRNIENIVFPKV
ncbi:MAG: hypothetical protein PVI97_00435 [Candidatus Thiodiazotropha sp.]|jgi:hypothetical protein